MAPLSDPNSSTAMRTKQCNHPLHQLILSIKLITKEIAEHILTEMIEMKKGVPSSQKLLI